MRSQEWPSTKKQTNKTKTWTSLVEARFQLIFGDALKVGHVWLSIFFLHWFKGKLCLALGKLKAREKKKKSNFCTSNK